MSIRPEVTVVVESYTIGETSSVDRLRAALTAASRMLAEHGNGELFVTDADGDPALAELLEREFPHARRIDARGLDYDEAKLRAAVEARSDTVLYLDGDCIPSPGWLEAHLQALRSGAHATGGLTRYDASWPGAIESVMDFGFLLPAGDGVLGCYASNNSGFRRATLLEEPYPAGPMRCRCYPHAQALLRRGTPVRMVPAARVRHQRVPFFSERYRRGYDAVAAAWIDPSLREARWARAGVFGVPLLYAQAVSDDWRRLRRGWRDLGLARWQAAVSVPIFPAARLIDAAGMIRALAPGGRASSVGLKHATG